jgi:hypothetical protein
MRDMHDTEMARTAIGGTSKPLRTATYLLRFTPDEKAGLEQKVREAAAEGRSPLTLADALREGAALYLDDLRRRLAANESDAART